MADQEIDNRQDPARPDGASASEDPRGESPTPASTPPPPVNLHPASSIPPEHMTTAAVVAGSSGSIGKGIATAGALDMAQGEVDYQRRWAQRIREAHGWQKVWRIIWG